MKNVRPVNASAAVPALRVVVVVAVEIVATAAEVAADTAIATKPQSLNPAGKIAVSNLNCGQLAAGLDVASDANWNPVENRIAVVPYGSGFVRNRK